MARNVFSIVILCSLFFVWADDDEQRWNTPPELIPEQVVKKSETKSERPRSLSVPITANINLNSGNNAHSLGFQVGPEGLSYSESNSFSRPLSAANGISQSQSLSFSAGSTGIAGATSQAVSQHGIQNQQGIVNSQAIATASASASASSNAHAASASASSSGSMYSWTPSNVENGGFSEELNIRFPGPTQGANRFPIWTNIRPNHNGQHPSRLPKLNIDVRPHDEFNRGGPITLHVHQQGTRWQERRPNVHIHKWQPSYRSSDIYER